MTPSELRKLLDAATPLPPMLIESHFEPLLRVAEAAEELRDINATTSPALRQAREEMLDAALAALREVKP